MRQPQLDSPVVSWFVVILGHWLGHMLRGGAYYFNSISLSELFDNNRYHYSDVIMGVMASQITSFTSVYSSVYSGADQRKHQSSASLAFVRGIHQWPVNSPHKGPVTWKMFPFYDVIIVRSDVFVWHLKHYWYHLMVSFNSLKPSDAYMRPVN